VEIIEGKGKGQRHPIVTNETLCSEGGDAALLFLKLLWDILLFLFYSFKGRLDKIRKTRMSFL